MPASRAEAPPRLLLPGEVAAEIVAAARRAAPREACGILVGRTARHATEVARQAAARNLHRRPAERFHLAPEDFLAAERAARAAGVAVVGFWHSHPASAAVPSAVDRAESWDGYSYLIVSLAGGRRPELRSWRFREGEPVEEEVVESTVGDGAVP